MKTLPFLLSALLAYSTCLNVYADDFTDETSDDDIFADTDTNVSKQNTQTANKTLSAFISSRLPASSAKNIENAAEVFCYTVDYAQADYSGYTINDLAITGSCGELSADGKNLIKDMLLNNNLVFSTATDSCNINPRILLRYINGIDSTDILLSAPCHSLTFFHGRDISTLNAAPGKDIVEQIVSTYSSLSEKFLSPALLGQMVPNGQVLTQDQKEIVRKINTIESPKKWSKKQTTNTTAQTPAATKPAPKGWNKLK